MFALVAALAMVGCGDDDEDPSAGQVTAEAGAGQTVNLGQTVTLNGVGNDTGGGTLTFLWEVTNRPAGSVAFITSPLTSSTSFTPDVAGNYTVRFTVVSSTGGQATDDVGITVEQSTTLTTPVDISGSISTDSVLTKIATTGADYRVTSTVFMSAKLTIEPGVIVEFSDDTGLAIGTEGTLVAIGTQTNPITLTGVQQTKGFWKGIELESNNAMNELTYVNVEFGGSGGFDGAGLLSNLIVQQSGRVKITNSSFTDSDGYGIYTRDLESVLPEFSNNTLTRNEAPVMTLINHYHYFDGASDYDGNTNDYIDSDWSNDEVDENVTWNALNVPYRMANNVETIQADVVVSPGVELLGQPNGGLAIGVNGSFNAVGTAGNIISIRGEQDVDGY